MKSKSFKNATAVLSTAAASEAAGGRPKKQGQYTSFFRSGQAGLDPAKTIWAGIVHELNRTRAGLVREHRLEHAETNLTGDGRLEVLLPAPACEWLKMFAGRKTKPLHLAQKFAGYPDLEIEFVIDDVAKEVRRYAA